MRICGFQLGAKFGAFRLEGFDEVSQGGVMFGHALDVFGLGCDGLAVILDHFFESFDFGAGFVGFCIGFQGGVVGGFAQCGQLAGEMFVGGFPYDFRSAAKCGCDFLGHVACFGFAGDYLLFQARRWAVMVVNDPVPSFARMLATVGFWPALEMASAALNTWAWVIPSSCHDFCSCGCWFM